jgi:hypothetical protein
MAIDTDLLASDLDELQDDLPATITYAGTSYSVAAGDGSGSMKLELDGIGEPFDILFVCKVSDFPSVPLVGQPVYYQSKKRTITRVEVDAANVGFTLYCESAY